jgi:regulator of protease activity HflC (stomatin/prohibitin superfamily)
MENQEKTIFEMIVKSKWFKIIGTVLGLFILVQIFFNFEMVDPGEEVVITEKWGSDKGIQRSSLGTGMIVYSPFMKMTTSYPNTIQVWEPGEFDITTTEKLVVHCKPRINIRIVPGKSPMVFDKYKTPLSQILDGQLKTYLYEVSRSIQGWKLDSMMSNRNQLDGLFKAQLIKYLAHDGNVWLVDQCTINPKVPESVQAAIKRKTEAITNAEAARAEAEGQKAQGEKNKAMAEATAATVIATAKGNAEAIRLEAQGKADANRILSASITPQVIRMEELKNQKSWIDNWGKGGAQVPNFMMDSKGGGSNFLLDLKGVSKKE